MKMLPFLFASIALICTKQLLGQVSVWPLTGITVTISPAKATLFAGEMQTFVATVVGIDDQSVNWSVEEENGGTITDRGLYVAPKIQGVYHITAASTRRPQTKAVATVTILAYCDPIPPAFRP